VKPLAACVLVVALLGAVLPLRAQIVLHDDRGATLTLAAPVQRVVSLLPSLTESVCALGACARLVGTDRYSNEPERVRKLPKLGGLEDAQVERIVALRPDVVLAAPAARVIERLEALGLKVLVLESRNRSDVRNTLTTLAQAIGEPTRAEAVWAQIDARTQAAATRVPATMRGLRVYFEVDATPYAAGTGSFIGETLRQLGLANIVPAELGPFPKLNPEYVVRAQPDVVMAAARNLAEMPGRPGWRRLSALQGRRACGFDAARYELVTRPGPRMGEAAEVLADCLQGLAR
jgi:iron complex transport system substrate-binding protein